MAASFGPAESVVIVERLRLVRETLAAVLARHGLEVRPAASRAEATARRDSAPPTFVLAGIAEAGDLDLVGSLRRDLPAARLVVLGRAVDLGELTAAFAAGADGYLPHDLAPAALMQSLRLVRAGEKVFPTALAGLLVREFRRIS